MLTEAVTSFCNHMPAPYFERVDLTCLIGDILHLSRYDAFFSRLSSGRGKLFGLLGGSIGNFSERSVLHSIQSVMNQGDLLLLGVEWIAGRSADDTRRAYAQEENFEFVTIPLRKLGKHVPARGTPQFADWAEEHLRVAVIPHGRTDPYAKSDVPGSRTVYTFYREEGIEREVMLAHSTKYEKESFVDFVRDHFTLSVIAEAKEARRYSLFLLRKE